MRSLTSARLWEEKVAEQPSDGGDSVLNLLRREAHWPSSRPEMREQRGLNTREDLDAVADANRSGNGAHGAERTPPPEKRLPEALSVGNAK